MYLKVALLVSTIFLFSGCSLFNEPQMPTQNSNNLGVVAVESNTTVIPLESNSTIQETIHKKKKKYAYLKPEPFSLESDKKDPELLGPQTTMARGLNQEETPLDTNSTN